MQAQYWVGWAIADVIGLNLARKSGNASIKMLIREWNGTLVVVERNDAKRTLRKWIQVVHRADLATGLQGWLGKYGSARRAGILSWAMCLRNTG